MSELNENVSGTPAEETPPEEGTPSPERKEAPPVATETADLDESDREAIDEAAEAKAKQLSHEEALAEIDRLSNLRREEIQEEAQRQLQEIFPEGLDPHEADVPRRREHRPQPSRERDLYDESDDEYDEPDIDDRVAVLEKREYDRKVQAQADELVRICNELSQTEECKYGDPREAVLKYAELIGQRPDVRVDTRKFLEHHMRRSHQARYEELESYHQERLKKEREKDTPPPIPGAGAGTTTPTTPKKPGSWKEGANELAERMAKALRVGSG
jgi:hypothetical protein